MYACSSTSPAGGGRLPVRVIAHQVEGEMPFATHLEVWKHGAWVRASGCYFRTEAEARRNYRRRCAEMGVTA